MNRTLDPMQVRGSAFPEEVGRLPLEVSSQVFVVLEDFCIG